MGTVEDLLGSRLGLRSSRVASNTTYGDHEEREQLISASFDNEDIKNIKKSQGRRWKAKREDYDDDVFGISTNQNSIQLQRRSTAQLPDQCVEAEICQGDTLAKIALRYNVPISELKRVNNLLNEAEFHALPTIKVPVKADSILTEILPEATSGTLGRLGGEVRSTDGWYVKSVVGKKGHDPYLSDPTSSPLSASEASSEVGVGEVIHIHDDIDNLPTEASPYISTNSSNNKQAKRVNRMLKNVDKDLARIKEREASRSISPNNTKSANLLEDPHTVSLALSTSPQPITSNDVQQFFSSTLGQQSSGVKVTKSTHRDNPWCTRSALFCIASIVLAVIIICLIAYHFDHTKYFLTPSSNVNMSENNVDSTTA